MRLVQTCEACPEQYDVFDGPKKVGYLRLRWGNFVAWHTPTGSLKVEDGARPVYEEFVGPTGLSGEFPDEESRAKHLEAAMQAIRKAGKDSVR